MSVVVFHYTTRYQELYGGVQTASLSLPWGYLGVNLFFIISGLVIFMTLQRTQQPLDFVVSRFSRLYPTYWVCIWITFAVVSAFGLAGKEVSFVQAALNMLMAHGFAQVPHVDGVYWTLEVELLFYAGMLLLFTYGSLHRVHHCLWTLFGIRLLYLTMDSIFGIELSWTLSRLLILPYLAWFALGICVYQAIGQRWPRAPWLTWILALAVIGLTESWIMAGVASVMSASVWLAASGRMRWMGARPLVFLGSVSYPLYLLHENVGWVVLRELQALGWSIDLAILCTLALSIALAAAVSIVVERPALAWIRDRYRRMPTITSPRRQTP